MRILRPAIFALLLMPLLATQALTHSALARASPAPGSKVQRSPTQVKLWFTEELEPAFSSIAVFAADGHEVDKKDSAVSSNDKRMLVVSLPPLSPGRYKVVWRVVSVEGAVMGNGLSDALDLRTLSAVLVKTEFGRVWIWHLLAAVLLLCGLIVFRGNAWNIVTISRIAGIAAILVATLAWTGHAVMRSGWADLAVQTMHALAASAWLGGLPPLGYILLKARRDQIGEWHAIARRVLPRYSRAGYFAVGVILLTGSFNSWTLVGNIHALVGTTYGHILLAKIALFGVMVTLALVNRFGLVPVVTTPSSTAREMRSSLSTLRRTVAFEQLLALMVLGAVSVLGTIAPGMMG